MFEISGIPVLAFTLLMIVLNAAVLPAQDKLPGGVSFRLKEADRLLQPGERAMKDGAGAASSQWKIETAQQAVKSAREKMKEIADKFAGQFAADHPDIVKMNDRLAALEAAAGGKAQAEIRASSQAASQAAASSEASAPWLARLKPYITPGGRPEHDPAQYLIPSASQDTADMSARLKIYAEATDALNAFRAAKVVSPTPELAETAEKLETSLNAFTASCTEYAARDLAEGERKIADLEAFTQTQQTKRTSGETFLYADKGQFAGIRSILDRGARLLDPREARLLSLRSRLDALLKADGELREARIAETKMTPDRYRGPDLAEIKAKAGQFLRKSKPTATVLGTTVISPDWQEESVLEYTDTTRTALRYRVTRSLTVQIGAREGSAYRLHTLDVSKDRRSDGGFGELSGHVMFTDPILEKNIVK